MVMDVLDALDSGEKSLTKRLSRTIEKVSERGWSEPRISFAPSKLFYCARGAFCRRAGCPESPSALSIMRMRMGTAAHEIIQGMLKGRMGFGNAERKVQSYNAKEDDSSGKSPHVVGKIDGTILTKGILVEIKTAGGFTAKSLAEGKVPSYYLDQAMLYTSLWNQCAYKIWGEKKKLNQIWFVCMDRDSMQWLDVPLIKVSASNVSDIWENIRVLNNLWLKGKLPEPSPKCDVKCEYYSTCRRADRLSDLLPGGKLRNE